MPWSDFWWRAMTMPRDPQGQAATTSTNVRAAQSDRVPPPALTDSIASDCGVDLAKLISILIPTQSLAGATQVRRQASNQAPLLAIAAGGIS